MYMQQDDQDFVVIGGSREFCMPEGEREREESQSSIARFHSHTTLKIEEEEEEEEEKQEENNNNNNYNNKSWRRLLLLIRGFFL